MSMPSKKLTSKQFLEDLESLVLAQRQLIEAECDGFKVDKLASSLRVKNATKSYKFFVQTYFPHYIKGDTSEFHDYVFEEIPPKIDTHVGCQEAIAAPRGEAKSTLLTQLLTLWCVVTKRKHFIGIIMDAIDQSAQMLEAIKVELESNPRLSMDFPNACGAGRVWNVAEIVTSNNIKIKIAGAAKKLRGWRFGPHRPDLILLDDIENDENVRKLDQRDKLEAWLKKAVMKLGPPDGSMDIIYIGTLLHHNSVLSRTIKSPTWHGKVFQAIKKWPDRMDLWEKWEEILINQGREAALAYYETRQSKMNAGSVTSWPSMRPIYRLMLIRADDHHAFDCEMQNDPINSADALFNHIAFWVQPSRQWVFYAACDPSLGKKNKSRDPSAILVGGFDRSTGILDVVEASIVRRVPDKIISDIIEYQREYKCLAWSFESIQFQEFLRTELVKRSAIAGVPVPALPVMPNTDKDLRIQSLQPHTKNELIRLHRNQHVLREQLAHYPEADHDDGPDCLEMLWSLAVSRAGGIPSVKTRSRRSRRKYHNYEIMVNQ